MSLIDGSVRYAVALEALRYVEASSVLDITGDDYEFLTGNRLWLATDRSRVRRVVEAMVYGPIDVVGLRRFPAPVEFIAAAIAFYVHPVNIQLACSVFEGVQYSDNLTQGIDAPCDPAILFAHVLTIRAGRTHTVDAAERLATRRLKMGSFNE